MKSEYLEFIYDPAKKQYLRFTWSNLVFIANIEYVDNYQYASEFSESVFAKYVCLCYAKWKLKTDLRFKRFMNLYGTMDVHKIKQ
jgi:hypothetical protein